ncbi:DUF6790 family protein [Microvirga zambiensis]|uniref:DUF6790 family protein n=1 Tax=Microvirga zambiensis TaxID=1402137 RepID=UPI00191FD931|nr:DUF6790 family protein [Microvirga zambiensis]
MYLVIVLGLTVVLPVASILFETLVWGAALGLPLIGKWFVFWAIGIRLFLAGIRQVLQPSFTAATIFRIKDPEAENLVSEIGFGNLSMGLIGIVSLAAPDWLVPSGVAGGLYLGLAGLKHIASKDRTREETIAMVTDLFVALIVGIAIVAILLRHA